MSVDSWVIAESSARRIAIMCIPMLFLAACQGALPEDNENLSTTLGSGPNEVGPGGLSLTECGDDLACQGDAINIFLDECMESAGFVRVLLPDGTYKIDAGGLVDEVNEAWTDCTGQLADLLPTPPVADDAFFNDYYDFLVDLKDCVEDQGYPVADPPSKEAFVESQGALWHPYENLDSVSENDLASLESVCPQNFSP